MPKCRQKFAAHPPGTPCHWGLVGYPRRVDHRLRHRFALLPPTRQHLLIFTAGNRPVEGCLQGIDQAVAFFGGCRHPRFFRPQAHHPGLAVKRRFIGCHRLRAEKDIRPPGLDIEIAGGIIGQVDRLGLRPSGGAVVLVPAQQDPLLIGADPTITLRPARSAGPFTAAISLVDFTEKARESTR